MSEVERIRDQVRRAFQGDAWHGPSVSELLRDVSAADAAAHPIEKAHSIREIVEHLTAWATIVRQRIESSTPPEITAEVDWPPVGKPGATGKVAWKRALERLAAAHAALDATIAGLGDAALARKAKGSPSTVYVLLHGLVQHDLYHAGQIALLRKAIGAR